MSDVAIAQLEQVRWELRDRLSATLIVAGRYVEAIALLRSLIAEDPLREGMWARLIGALNGVGRRGEALTAFQQARRLLLDQLGVDPGPQLEEAQRQVLAGEPPRVDVEPAGVETLRPARPAGLPRDIPDFVGHDADMQALLEVGRRGSQVAVVDGMPGSGKTTLALHVAHMLADDYPDGQVFCDLRGHDRQAAPTAAVDVLGGLLRSFGVREEAIPADADERAAQWRSILASRRVLVMLDDAIDAAQIRPLLPGGGRCFVIVTSRRRLAEPDGAYIRTIDPLSEDSALVLLGAAVGDDRVAADPATGRDAVRLCGNLPIAVRIAAHRLRQRPAWSVSALVQRLRDEQTRLAELRVANRDLLSIFATSYVRLDIDGQRLFRLVGTTMDCDVDRDSVAALADMPPARAEVILEALLDQHLLTGRCDGRYRMHPLLRSYAWRLVRDAGHPVDHHRVARPAIRGRAVTAIGRSA
jgi:RecA/RadA recombinase